jgi:hypothetical protein
MSVSDLYIPTMGLLILLQENMWTDPRNIQYVYIALRHMKLGGLGPRSSFSGNTLMGFSFQCVIFFYCKRVFIIPHQPNFVLQFFQNTQVRYAIKMDIHCRADIYYV